MGSRLVVRVRVKMRMRVFRVRIVGFTFVGLKID